MPKQKYKEAQITIRISEKNKKALERIAKKHRVPLSEAVRHMLEYFVAYPPERLPLFEVQHDPPDLSAEEIKEMLKKVDARLKNLEK